MGGSNALSFAVILLLVLASAFFSATETAYSSLNRIRVKNMAAEGSKRAALVLRQTENYDATLATILVGNNIVNIAMASLATVLFVGLLGPSGVPISTITITVLVLIFGEITPKSLAKQSPERFALFSAPLLQALGILLTPVTYLFGLWRRLVARVFKTKAGQSITEQELRTMVEEAEEDGAIAPDDAEIIQSAFAFNDSKVLDILTPRVDVEAVPLETDNEALARLFIDSGYTRIPVYRGNIDNIAGVVHLHDFFAARQQGGRPLADILLPVPFIHPHTKINRLLELLQTEKSHLAVVADEYGGTMGIVTMEDILEELVGEIWDEHDEVERDVRPMAGGGYRIAGRACVQDVFELLGFATGTECTTVSGWITERLERLPRQGDEFETGGVAVRVLQVSDRRVGEAVFRRLAPGGKTPNE